MSHEQQIFKKGSTTFFVSSLFFPKDIKQDVFELYSFVRVADDYVDQVPADKDGFYRLRRIYQAAADDPNFDTSHNAEDETDLAVTKNILRVAKKRHLEQEWITAFLNAMQSDLIQKKYETLDETLGYIYGSAEVIGLMMARIMQLSPEAEHAARMQGRAMQYINFIRDIEEDNRLGRQYFPAEDLKMFDLENLNHETAQAKPGDFKDFILYQTDRYGKWQAEAEEGYKYIPRRLRVPVKTAADMYDWTAKKIEKTPQVIFEKKVKPSKPKVISAVISNMI